MNSCLSIVSISFVDVFIPSSFRDVTPYSLMPHGTMPVKCDRFGLIFKATPWNVIHLRTRMPRAAIFASLPFLSVTHIPTRPWRRSPVTFSAFNVFISHCSRLQTNFFISCSRCFKFSIT